MNKYRNRKTVHREIKFDSVAEESTMIWQYGKRKKRLESKASGKI